MDYYDLLGVSRQASDKDLKNAFKNKAREHHPDKGGDPEKFKQINEAYQNLSDPQKRQLFILQEMALVVDLTLMI